MTPTATRRFAALARRSVAPLAVALAVMAAPGAMAQPVQLGPPAAKPGAPAAAPKAPDGKPHIAPKPKVANTGTNYTPDQRVTMEKVNAYFNKLRTLVGDFVQVGPDGSRTEGKFYIEKPGRVRFQYAAPSPIELIADGTSVAVRDRKLATQDIYPLSQTPLRFLLADKIDLLRDTTVVGVSQDNLYVTVVIEEKQLVTGKNRLTLMFDAGDLTLKQWTVTDAQGYDTTVAIYNADPAKKPDAGLFRINYQRILQ